MIAGYFTDIKEITDPSIIHRQLSGLPAPLQSRILSYSPTQQLSRLCGKLLLQQLLLDYCPGNKFTLADLTYDQYAKPYVDASIDFSIAHSGDMVIVILTSGGQVGVDVEQVKNTDISCYEDYFTTTEWANIHSSAIPLQAFYTAWVRKEAVLKATGKGIFMPMKEIDSYSDTISRDGISYFLKDIYLAADYVACIASDKKDMEIKISKVGWSELLDVPLL